MTANIRRTVLGKRADGSFGLDCSLDPYDALLNDRNDVGMFSFCSDWTDFSKLVAVGTTYIGGYNNDQVVFVVVPIPDKGYKPHVEVRMLTGLRTHDDSYTDSQVGIGAFVDSNQMRIQKGSFGFSMFYVVYDQALVPQ